MAQYRLSMKVGKSNSKPHYDYINREGAYKSYNKGEDFIYSESQNLPIWANNGEEYWKAVNELEKGTQYRELEISLPQEFNNKQNIKLTQEFCENVFGKNYTYSFSIHKNIGKLSNQENPHAHIMFSEKLIDHNRKQEPTKFEYFTQRRKDKTTGEYKNGYIKDRNITGANRREWLKEKRKIWEVTQNQHLIENDIEQKVSCKTLKEQGIVKIPQIHLGTMTVNLSKKGICTEKFRNYLKIELENNLLEKINTEFSKYKTIYDTIQEDERVIKGNKIAQVELSYEIIKLKKQERKYQETIDTLSHLIDVNRKQIKKYNHLLKEIKKYEEQSTANKFLKKTISFIRGEESKTEYKEYLRNKQQLQIIEEDTDLKEYSKNNLERKYKQAIQDSIQKLKLLEMELNIKEKQHKKLIIDTQIRKTEIDMLLRETSNEILNNDIVEIQEGLHHIGKGIGELLNESKKINKERNRRYNLER